MNQNVPKEPPFGIFILCIVFTSCLLILSFFERFLYAFFRANLVLAIFGLFLLFLESRTKLIKLNLMSNM